MRHARSRSSAAQTGLISAAMALMAGVISSAWLVGDGWQALISSPVGACILATAFFLAEQNLVSFEFRRQSHSMTFAGVPLALGVLLLPVPCLVIVRVCGSVAAMLVQRTSAEKVAYNISAFAFEAAATGTFCRLVITGLDPVSVLTLIGCVAVVDQLMTALVFLVIRIHGIATPRRDVAEVAARSLVLSIIATSFAVTLRILLMHGVTGESLAVVLVAIAVLGYRMYAATVRRHHTVTTIHEFVTSGASTTSLAELADDSLTRVRHMSRASSAELVVTQGDQSAANSWTVYSVDEDDRLSTHPAADMSSDWVRLRAVHNGIATLAVRGNDEGIDAWLDTAGTGATRLDDAVVVPVQTGTQRFGTLMVSGRLTDVAVFTDDDLQMLQTIAGHLAASIHNARLLETLSYDATHDALTGLSNRSKLIADIAALDDRQSALFVVDLDHFKDVNDVFGHEVADELLGMVADRLGHVRPTPQTVARVGGDEFAILLQGEASRGDLHALAQTFADHLAEPFELRGATVCLSVSIGVAATSSVASHELLRCADTAMYAAKARADRIASYSPAMDLGRAERIALAADLRLALDHAPEQFVIYLQPKVDLHSGRAHGAEALVRWNHPALGILAPDRFIPLAEATGLIAALTRHVLAAAVTECSLWNDANGDTDVAVNLSTRVLTDLDVASMVQEALESSGLPPQRLVLEITESVMIDDADAAISALQRIVELGVRLSLDDFGTGYSSLAYLQRLPVSELKVDRSFVQAAGATSSRASVLLRNIITLGRDLGMQLIAEGIETPVQADALAALGCAMGQGYLFARPMAADEFRIWLQRNRDVGLRLLPSA